MTTSLESLATGKYLSLTTFKRDGSAVATPVWFVREGDALRVVTDVDAGKAKRIRNSGSVLVAPCDMRGNIQGDQVPATAELQDADATVETAAAIRARYGIVAWFMMRRAQRKVKKTGVPTQVGIVIRLSQTGD
ncbi:MAG: PPOX class F420-dependent oxidoreductase [Actinomycetes bacterium]